MSIPQIKRKDNKSSLPAVMDGYRLAYLMNNGKYYCNHCASNNWDDKIMYKYLWHDDDIKLRCGLCNGYLIPNVADKENDK